MKRTLLYLLPFVLVVVAWVFTPFVMRHYFVQMPERGQAGDLFGSINALFSGLAFAGVIIAILLQREELALQRQELSLTRQELRRTASAQEEARDALQATMYAQTFKVALDFLDSPENRGARELLHGHRQQMGDREARLWSTDLQKAAESVVRNIEAVGAMTKRKLIPPDYLTSTRSVNILDYWEMLSPFVTHIRKSRDDPYFAQDFEYLATLAQAYLKGEVPADQMKECS